MREPENCIPFGGEFDPETMGVPDRETVRGMLARTGFRHIPLHDEADAEETGPEEVSPPG
jgi:hypothetical protein